MRVRQTTSWTLQYLPSNTGETGRSNRPSNTGETGRSNGPSNTGETGRSNGPSNTGETGRSNEILKYRCPMVPQIQVRQDVQWSLKYR